MLQWKKYTDSLPPLLVRVHTVWTDKRLADGRPLIALNPLWQTNHSPQHWHTLQSRDSHGLLQNYKRQQKLSLDTQLIVTRYPISTEKLTRLGTGRIKLDHLTGLNLQKLQLYKAEYSIAAKYVDSTFSLSLNWLFNIWDLIHPRCRVHCHNGTSPWPLFFVLICFAIIQRNLITVKVQMKNQ